MHHPPTVAWTRDSHTCPLALVVVNMCERPAGPSSVWRTRLRTRPEPSSGLFTGDGPAGTESGQLEGGGGSDDRSLRSRDRAELTRALVLTASVHVEETEGRGDQQRRVCRWPVHRVHVAGLSSLETPQRRCYVGDVGFA